MTLARRADSFVFGPTVPAEAAAATYWESVDAERRAMSREVGTWQRLRAAVSLRSLRPGRPRRGADTPDGARADDDSLVAPAPGRPARLRRLADWRSRRTPD